MSLSSHPGLTSLSEFSRVRASRSPLHQLGIHHLMSERLFWCWYVRLQRGSLLLPVPARQTEGRLLPRVHWNDLLEHIWRKHRDRYHLLLCCLLQLQLAHHLYQRVHHSRISLHFLQSLHRSHFQFFSDSHSIQVYSTMMLWCSLIWMSQRTRRSASASLPPSLIKSPRLFISPAYRSWSPSNRDSSLVGSALTSPTPDQV